MPGRLIARRRKPKLTDTASASVGDTPSMASAKTVAPSLTPHPDKEIGSIDTKKTGGMRIMISNKSI